MHEQYDVPAPPNPPKKKYPQPSHAFNCVNTTELALFVRLHTYMKTMCMGCRECSYGRFAQILAPGRTGHYVL